MFEVTVRCHKVVGLVEDCKARDMCYSQLQECKDETFAFAVSLPGCLGVLPVGADRGLQTLEWEGGSRGSVEAY
jgi:hypothetical protein